VLVLILVGLSETPTEAASGLVGVLSAELGGVTMMGPELSPEGL